jgi:hypothetical protein
MAVTSTVTLLFKNNCFKSSQGFEAQQLGIHNSLTRTLFHSRSHHICLHSYTSEVFRCDIFLDNRALTELKLLAKFKHLSGG